MISKFKQLGMKASAALLMLCVQARAWAVDLPLADEVANEASDMDVFEFSQYVIKNAVLIVLLALSGFIFIQTVSATLTTFREWQNNKCDTSELAGKILTSIVLLVIVVVIIGFGTSNFE